MSCSNTVEEETHANPRASDHDSSSTRGVTDRPEEIHNCLLGEILVYAKASMTAAQAAMLQDHPDVSARTSYRWNSSLIL